MITGAHILFTSRDPEADRGFFRDVLGFPFVDVGHGWLIFGLPAAEAAVHPADGGEVASADTERSPLEAVVYLMCDDLRKTMQTLAAKNVHCTEVKEERWGLRTTVPLPSGAAIGLYQPTHPTALHLAR